MTRLVSDSFRSPPAGMAPIVHTAVVEIDAAILGAEIVAHLLQTPRDSRHFGHLIELLCSYYRGKGGEKPTSGALKQADDLAKAHVKWNAALASGKAPNAKSVIKAVSTVYEAARAAVLTGDPDKDWRTIRAVLEGGPCPRLREVGSEVRNIRILERGSQLRQSLTQDWRDNPPDRGRADCGFWPRLGSAAEGSDHVPRLCRGALGCACHPGRAEHIHRGGEWENAGLHVHHAVRRAQRSS